MNKINTLIFILLLVANFVCGQKIKNGSYIFKIKDIEYNGMIVGKCNVIVKNDSVKVFYTNGNLTFIKVGDIYAEGLLLKHKRTGKWIIGKNKEDINATEINPCYENGFLIIDFKKRIIEQC